MRFTEVRSNFESVRAARGWSEVNPPSTVELAEAMVDWYMTERVDGVDLDADGDMLLFQWGAYDWGNGPSFQVDITRQVINGDEVDDDGIWQLSATLHYPITPAATALGSGARWCGNPGDTGEFRASINASSATSVDHLDEVAAVRLEVDFGPV